MTSINTKYSNLLQIIASERNSAINSCVFHENFQLKESLNNDKIINLTESFAGLLEMKFPSVTGKNIIISLDNRWEFIISFFACTLTGNYPVPVASKTLMQKQDYLELLESIYEDSDAALIITTENVRKILPTNYHDKTVTIEELKENSSVRKLFRTDFDPQGPFFIQYSSGSTRFPKGVVVTHTNLMINLEQIKRGLNINPLVDSSLSWLPLHHDMGLVGMVFSAIYNQGTTHVMGPIDFIKSPYRWLKLASDLRVTIINSPNSGYHTTINKLTPEETKTLDLSHVRVAMSGAEPVNAKVIERFITKFTPAGLAPHAFFPVYGLAESTLAVTFPVLGEQVMVDRLSFTELRLNKVAPATNNDSDIIEIVSCGSPLPLTEVKITDAQKNTLPESMIGEILIRGASVSNGYYKKGGGIDSIKDEDGWCNTGDLGYLKNNNLYITGRKKDLIILNGKNISPHDLELKVSQVPSLRMGRIVIFSCMLPGQEKEKVFVVAECPILSKKKRQKIKHDAAIILGKFVPAETDQIFLVPPFHIRKTTSGKVKRFLMKELLLNGQIQRYENMYLKNYLKSQLFILGFIMKNVASKFLRRPD